ncbi:MAG: GUN4 domain-containing protein [Dolichospermum sp.]
MESAVYSLGVTCLHLLTGMSPFDLYSPMEGEWVWRDYLNGNLVSNELGKILEKLASPIAKHRYQSVKEVIQKLNFGNQNVTPQPPIKIPPPSITVPSQYQKLKKLLSARKWKEADEETRRIILTLANRGILGYLTIDNVLDIPSEDISIIDNLWVKNSNGRFGFSVQKRIYQSLGGNRKYDQNIWKNFGKKVGWKGGLLGAWKYYNDITFDIKAPEGHLPTGGKEVVWVLTNLPFWEQKHLFVSSLALRLVDCKI